MSLGALRGIVSSSKATVLIAVVALLAVGHFLGRIETGPYLEAVEVLVSAWFLAHAGEKGAQAIAEAKKAE